MDIALDSPIKVSEYPVLAISSVIASMNLLLQGRLTESLTIMTVHMVGALCSPAVLRSCLLQQPLGAQKLLALLLAVTVCMAAGKCSTGEAAAESRGRPKCKERGHS
jgi:hypothetical protein